MGRYVLGVDGGATKTHCALFDVEGNRVDFIDWGPTNHEELKGGFKGLEEELYKMIISVLDRNNANLNDLHKCVFGLAGVDTRSQHRIISDMISNYGVKDFILCNDAFLGIKAGCPGGYGICAINGTGCSIVGIDNSGRMLQIGGQGTMTGDCGGGGFLGDRVIKAVYDYLFRGGRYTVMMDILFNELEIASKYEFMDVITEKRSEGLLRVNELVKFLFKAANMDDEMALQILRNAGEGFGASVNGIINELDFNRDEVLNIVLAGSLNVKGENPALINALKDKVLSRNLDRDINFVILRQPPVAGAIVWSFEGEQSASPIFSKVIGQF